MRQIFDLNCAPVDQYPVTKILTRSDMTTSQLVLPRHSVEEFIVPHMPEDLVTRLRGERRANLWVVDDEHRLEHFLTMVDRDHRYSIISWGHVLQTRELREGQQIRFRWMNDKLHFIVAPEDNENSDENPTKEEEIDEEKNIEQDDNESSDLNKDAPPKKRMKDMGGSGDATAAGTTAAAGGNNP